MNTNGSNFFLMRHGETETNRNHIWQGSQDIPLNDNGRRQALEAALLVREIDPEFVITSNLSRAIETGDLAATYSKKAKFVVDPNLRERGCGAVEGLTTTEIQEKFNIHMEMTSTQLDNIPGAEPYNAFIDRIMTAMQKIYTEYSGRRVLVVSHGGVLRALYDENIGNLPGGMVFRNCAILSLHMENNRWSILDKYNTAQI